MYLWTTSAICSVNEAGIPGSLISAEEISPTQCKKNLIAKAAFSSLLKARIHVELSSHFSPVCYLVEKCSKLGHMS